MRTMFVCCLLAGFALPALAETPDAKASDTKPAASAFTYSASGTCLVSPEGFNSKLEPSYSGVAWTTSLATSGSVDDHGKATETGQAVDTASFGVGPRMHAPAAHAYDDTFRVEIDDNGKDNGATFRAGEIKGTFSAGTFTGKGFSISGFELKRFARHAGFDMYGTSPVKQTVSIDGGTRFERVCILTVSTFPKR